MKRDYIDFQHRSSPVGYLITFAVTVHGFTVTNVARLIDIIAHTARLDCEHLT